LQQNFHDFPRQEMASLLQQVWPLCADSLIGQDDFAVFDFAEHGDVGVDGFVVVLLNGLL
jgi:hypothetical protein